MEYVCSTKNRDTWLKRRRSYLGASEAAGILGISKWSSPYSIWSDHVIGTSQESTERMAWGLVLESAILEESDRRFESVDGRTIRASGEMFVSDEFPWACATLDGTASLNGEIWPVEVKNVDAFAAQDWEDGVPAYYIAQCQWQMMVTGARRVTVVALIGGNRWVWQDVERDASMIARLQVEGALLWHRIQTREAPPVDGHDATARALGQIPVTSAEPVTLPKEVEVLTAEVDDLERVRKYLKGELEDIEGKIDTRKNMIRLTLGGNECGRLSDGRFWQWKLEARSGYVVKPSESRVLRLKAAKAAKKGRAA